MVVLSCAAAHSGALPPRRRKSPFQYIMTQAAPARRAQRAPNQRGSGDEVPRGGWEGTRRSRVGGQGACPLLGLKGQSPWSRTLDLLQRGSPSASRARATHPSCVVRRATMPIPPCARIPKAPKTKNRKMGFERAERPFAEFRGRASGRVQGIVQLRVPSGDFAEGESNKQCWVRPCPPEAPFLTVRPPASRRGR